MMPAHVTPPYSHITAYDLNTGTIKWQVPDGEAVGVDPPGNNFGIIKVHGPKAPRATHKVPPVVPAGIRPRIKSPIPVDILVHVDSHGRVTDAAPAVKQHPGLESYLAERAVTAAKQWRFDPARENGRAVPGTETIHFVFER